MAKNNKIQMKFMEPNTRKISADDITKSPNIFSKQMKLSDLVTYQAGSIVSRVLLENEGGTVTLFAFDIGQGLNEHTAPFDAMVYVVEGEAELTISGKRLPVGQGETIIMLANKPHSVKANKRLKMLLVMLRS